MFKISGLLRCSIGKNHILATEFNHQTHSGERRRTPKSPPLTSTPKLNLQSLTHNNILEFWRDHRCGPLLEMLKQEDCHEFESALGFRVKPFSKANKNAPREVTNAGCFLEDLDSTPIHIAAHSCNSIPKGSDALFWPQEAPGTHMMHRHARRKTSTHMI